MTRRKTLDRGPPGLPGSLAIHAVEQISTNMLRLPNGNLLCMNVPIARTGWLIYGPDEVPVEPGTNGVSYVERTADALFVDTVINSINAAAVTNEHPEDDVTPENWKQFSGGFALNARRGTGDDADVVLADLMLTDKDLITEVLAGKREVSWGYDADYQDRGGGLGGQYNMLTNHIALVKKGRCGPRCAIGDSEYQPPPKESKMATRVKLRGARRTIDQAALSTLQASADAANAALEDALAEEEGDGRQDIHVHIGDPSFSTAKTMDAEVEQRFVALEGTQATILERLDVLIAAKTGDALPANAKPALTLDSSDEDLADDEADDDERKAKKKELRDAKSKPSKTTDSAALATSYAELMSQAEILSPGFKSPTFDAAMQRAATVDRMCSVRRKVLDQVALTADGAAMLTGLNGGKALDTLSMDCASTAVLFTAAAGAKALLNNAAATRDGATVPKPAAEPKPFRMPTAAEINEANAKHWEGH